MTEYDRIDRIVEINGVKKHYDVCSEKKDAYDPEKFIYIGQSSRIWIDGRAQPEFGLHHFWIYKHPMRHI